MSIRYETVATTDAFKAVAQLEAVIWNASPHDAVSPHTLHAFVHNGGVVIGAFDGEQMVGFVIGFPAKRGDQVLMWSQVAGVHPDYQRQGIGYQLKQAQRTWALSHGYDTIAWTFDPLRALNARFNFNRLGITCHTYLVNHYGTMDDDLNAGMASDRLEAWWELNSPRTRARAEDGAEVQPDVNLADVKMLMFEQFAGENVLDFPEQLTEKTYCVEIPPDINAIKKAGMEEAKVWQLHLRKSLSFCFEQGYHIIGVRTDNKRAWYILCPMNA